MCVELKALVDRLDLAARQGDFDRFEFVAERLELALAELPRDRALAARDTRRRIVEARAELVSSRVFLAENGRLAVALAAAEDAGDRAAAARLSEALHRRGKAIMATMRPAEDDADAMPEPVRALFAAIEAGDLDATRAALPGTDLNARHGGFEATPLYHALTVQGRSIDMVELLIGAGADPNMGMADGYAPLHGVAGYHWGWEPPVTTSLIAECLVAAGGNIEARTDSLRWTPLHRAVLEGNAQELEALLRAGANPNQPFDGRSEPWFTPGRLPLQLAGHDRAKVRMLLEHGADPRARDLHGDDVAGYLRHLIAEHLAHGTGAEGHRAALEGSLALIRGWPGRS